MIDELRVDEFCNVKCCHLSSNKSIKTENKTVYIQ